MLKNKELIWIAVIALTIGLSACGGNKTNNEKPPAENNGGTTANTAAAETVYSNNCVSCHAVDLSGGVGPNLKAVGASLSIDQIKKQIENGGNGMPAYKGQLSDAEIAALSSWLAEKKS